MRKDRTVTSDKQGRIFNMIRLRRELNNNVSFLFSSLFVLTRGTFVEGPMQELQLPLTGLDKIFWWLRT